MKLKINLAILATLLLSACGLVPSANTANPVQGNSEPAMENSAQATNQLNPTPTTGMVASPFPDLGPAPELENTVWINTDHPLRIKDLRGKVVLLEMWTFDCINCQHVIPSLKGWYQKYASQGLVIIGNHFPEFDFERDLSNLQDAVKQDGITYPVAQDNDGKTWSAYHNLYWPTAYLIDKRGHIRYTHIGEGSYTETEAAIQSLLAEPLALSDLRP